MPLTCMHLARICVISLLLREALSWINMAQTFKKYCTSYWSRKCYCCGGRLELQKVALVSANTFSGSIIRTPGGGEGIPKVRCPRTSRLLQPVFHCLWVLYAKWARRVSCQIQQTGVRLEQRKLAKRMVSARFEVALQSALQEKLYVHFGRSESDGWRIGDGV